MARIGIIDTSWSILVTEREEVTNADSDIILEKDRIRKRELR